MQLDLDMDLDVRSQTIGVRKSAINLLRSISNHELTTTSHQSLQSIVNQPFSTKDTTTVSQQRRHFLSASSTHDTMDSSIRFITYFQSTDKLSSMNLYWPINYWLVVLNPAMKNTLFDQPTIPNMAVDQYPVPRVNIPLNDLSLV